MRLVFLWLATLLLLALELSAQTNPPPQGYRLHRVRRLKPAPLPPGGLVPYDGAYEWGLSDTLGRVYVQAVFEQEPEATAGPFWLLEWQQLAQNDMRSSRWWALHGDDEVWLNARGQYLVVPADYATYRQPDESLLARNYRRRLTQPLYRYEVTPHDADITETVPSPWRYWRYWRGLYYVGGGLYAMPGSWVRYRRHLRRHPVHVSLGPPEALFDSTSRRLTPYRYSRLGRLHDGRIPFQLARNPHTNGYLDRRGREVLGPYVGARPFIGGRAVVAGGDVPYQYGVIDTTGAYVLPLQPHELSDPDARGWLRRYAWLSERQMLLEYVLPNGVPVFPGRRFSSGSGFAGDSAAVTDTLGRTGVLYADGRWLPRPAPGKRKYRPAPRPTVQRTADGRFQLVKADSQLVNSETYAWAKPLAGNWFVVRISVGAAVALITPTGQPYPLPVGLEPDLTYHGVDTYAQVPFANGLLKVRWGKPFREGGEPRREAYMTRGGRVLSSDRSSE